MNLIEIVIAMVILGFFVFGFSQIFLPTFNEWNKATSEYYAAYTIQFIADSFREECAKTYPDMESWRRAVSAAKELESCEITELKKDDKLYAFKAACLIAGEHIEILGLCKP
jgi:spermidine/putrescine-binding protein